MWRKKDREKSCRMSPSVHHCTVAPPTPSAGGRGVVHGNVKGGGKQFEVGSQLPESCETGGKFLPQRGDDTNTSVRLHVNMYTSSFTSKAVMCAWMFVTRMSSPCNFTLRAFRSVVIDVRQKIILTKKRGDLLLHVAHTGHHMAHRLSQRTSQK